MLRRRVALEGLRITAVILTVMLQNGRWEHACGWVYTLSVTLERTKNLLLTIMLIAMGKYLSCTHFMVSDKNNNSHEAQPCYCGEPNCVGFLGGKTQTDVAAMTDVVLEGMEISGIIIRICYLTMI